MSDTDGKDEDTMLVAAEDIEKIEQLLKMPYNESAISTMLHGLEKIFLLEDLNIEEYLLRHDESNWEWLKKFIYERIFQNVSVEENEEMKEDMNKKRKKNKKNITNASQNQNLNWIFKNIQKLTGTNMPIFGGKTYPCVCLKMKGVSPPSYILTGIDRELENLMSNVPEVAVYHHVQKYDTKDLPVLNNAQFSPKIIMDVARNIFNFVENSVTKAGHTYWLIKDKNDDVVKLYDLTSLCDEATDDKEENPFTVPVAVLIYRVARNIKYSLECQKEIGTIGTLLKNCVQLLSKENHPQIITSAHYILADLYVPADTDLTEPTFVDQTKDKDTGNEFSGSQENPESAEQEEKDERKYKTSSISGTVVERCLAALDHVFQGLECLKYFPSAENPDGETKIPGDDEDDVKTCPEDMQNVAKAIQAIAISCTRLNQPVDNTKKVSDSSSSSQVHFKKNGKTKKNKKTDKMKMPLVDNSPGALFCNTKTETLPTWQSTKMSDILSWKVNLKTLLYEKASLIYAVLAEYEYSNRGYEASLGYILAGLRCQNILGVFCNVKKDKLVSYLLARAGDCCSMTVLDWRNIDNHKLTFKQSNDNEEKMVERPNLKNITINGAESLLQSFDNIKTTMIASLKCYEKAIELDPSSVDKNDLLDRMGKMQNELGHFHMALADLQWRTAVTQQGGSSINEVASTVVTSILERAQSYLNASIKTFETIRQAERVALAYCNIGSLMHFHANMNAKNSSLEDYYYAEALKNYLKAREILCVKERYPSTWQSVAWNLSTTFYMIQEKLVKKYFDTENKTDEMEREIIAALQKAVKHCDIETPGPRQAEYRFRAAIMHDLLGAFQYGIHQNLKRNQYPDSHEKRKILATLHLSEVSYKKAAELMLSLKKPEQFLTIQLVRIEQSEIQAETATTFANKLKCYQNGLDLALQCQPIFAMIREKNGAPGETAGSSTLQNYEKRNETNSVEKSQSDIEKEQFEENRALLEQRLKRLLHSLLMLCHAKNSDKDKSSHGRPFQKTENLADLYKQCYSLALKSDMSVESAYFDCILQEIERKIKEFVILTSKE